MVDALVSGASVERRVGSTPILGTKLRELSSAGSEHLPYKQRVGGSNPSAPTKTKRGEKMSRIRHLFVFYTAPWQIYLTKEWCETQKRVDLSTFCREQVFVRAPPAR